MKKAQITELITKFPEVFYIWNDGLDDEIMSIEEATDFFRNLPRPVLANNNWFDWGKKGQPYLDICTTEGKLPAKFNKLPTETCWTLEDEWFTGKCDNVIKTAEYMVAQILAANSRNSNFLLNVGPDIDGKITDESIKKLERIGSLLKPIRKILEEHK